MRFRCLVALLALVSSASLQADEFTSEQIEFFEQKIRPLFVEHCQKCHGADDQKGGLRLDARALLLKGGDTGPAIVPANADESELIRAVRYDPDGYQMPPDGKLPAEKIALLEQWVADGAAWPEQNEIANAGGSWEEAFAERSQHWSFQPLNRPAIPAVNNTAWVRTPIDRFILNAMESRGLRPAPAAPLTTMLRRAKFDVVGLPPMVDEIGRVTDEEQLARQIETWLASPHFGERWGRHWLDLVRYADTRGHEFDYDIPNAWHYRDYVIRAMNADVPYDQLVMEHVAGDLISRGRDVGGYATRIDPATGIGESIIGTGFWYFGDWLHSPVDLKQDESDRVMNMVDVFSKAFLGMTVSCAKCHDHKFDPITQRDYYAIAGYIASGHYEQSPFETLEHNAKVAAALDELDQQADRILRTWLAETKIPSPSQSEPPKLPAGISNENIIADYRDPEATVVSNGFAFGQRPRNAGQVRWGTTSRQPLAGVFDVAAVERNRVWDVCRSAEGVEDDLGVENWDRPGRTLITPSFIIKPGKIYAWVRGGCRTYAGVNSYFTIKGPLHGSILKDHPAAPEWRWIEQDLSRYAGHQAHLEFVLRESEDFAVGLVVQAEAMPALLNTTSPEAAALNERIAANRSDDAAVQQLLAQLQPLFEQRELLRTKIQTTSAATPVMLEGSGVDLPLFIRGNPHKTGEPVPRRFLEVFAEAEPADQTVSQTSGVECRPEAECEHSPRAELALQMLDPKQTPITARVIANRVWQHYFGLGLVSSSDDFGLMGTAPSHPELLDWLACELIEHGWSLKHLHRLILDSAVYRQASFLSSEATPEERAAWAAAEEADPTNAWLSRMRIRRLEGEALRDSLLAASGRLDEELFGHGIPIHLTEHHEGRGKPSASGPVDGEGRRSIYISVRRNFPEPFLQAFDFPVPSTTRGRRSTSNVPAQALALMNNPLVLSEAARFADRLLASDIETDDRIREAFLLAYARQPTDREAQSAREFLVSNSADDVSEKEAWTNFCHALFLSKEFAFVP